MWETWVRFLGWEDALEEGMATHSSTLAWRIHGQTAWWATVHGVAKVRTQLSRVRHDQATKHSTAQTRFFPKLRGKKQ